MNENIIIKNQELLKTFLQNKEIPKQYKVSENSIPFGYIYCIENKSNGKKYIGSTYSVWIGSRPDSMTQLKKRASDYIYEYNHGIKSKENNIKIYQRPLIQAMVDDGFENFIMYPIAETTRDTHNMAEDWFIQHFNTINNGYNKRRVDHNKSFRSFSKSHDANAKRLRSEPIISINLNLKKIIFAESMKLFADYMQTTKDMIKNSNRGAYSYKGWFSFYINEEKRYIVFKNFTSNKFNRKISDTAKKLYIDLYHSINIFLKSENKNEFFPDFEILDSLIYKD